MYKIKVKTRDKGLRKEDNALLLSTWTASMPALWSLCLRMRGGSYTLREKTSKKRRSTFILSRLGAASNTGSRLKTDYCGFLRSLNALN
ncbi:hypothetical protein SFC17_03015 [Bacillus paralicheniformis]|uniref:hypothetical protein n=1 Tax=Bacillus paralicheniformis TaxID=1648923 RepID=UPI0039819C7D